jgi:hypothetical protein
LTALGNEIQLRDIRAALHRTFLSGSLPAVKTAVCENVAKLCDFVILATQCVNLAGLKSGPD